MLRLELSGRRSRGRPKRRLEAHDSLWRPLKREQPKGKEDLQLSFKADLFYMKHYLTMNTNEQKQGLLAFFKHAESIFTCTVFGKQGPD
ncbi:hypothetical protein EXN66_Car012903 [Channa argus]|uniref:Uncharacterized protein n=1 Tax=Channa argus TaxID=215402 RepID=A0A6G1Q4D4_CHAAH|nr:hypothetical protein EXN66_Car012903 [Channa argus]